MIEVQAKAATADIGEIRATADGAQLGDVQVQEIRLTRARC